MLVFKSIENIPKEERGYSVAIGNFDGMHLGHQSVIEIAREKSNNSFVGVVTFEPHPRQYFQKNQPIFRLMKSETRKRFLDSFGIDALFELPFDSSLANLSPRDFIETVLLERLNVKNIVVGPDFRFGKNRTGGVEDLVRICSKHNIIVKIIDKQKKDSVILSSTNVRDLLRAGDFKNAEKMLGHKWLIKGKVISGDKRGREIGFPTANMEVQDFMEIKFGVYAVKIEIEGYIYNGISNYGIRPTFDGEKLLLETYLFDFSKDIYGMDIVVSFVEFIRDEKRFDSVDELKKQIDLDIDKTIKILGS